MTKYLVVMLAVVFLLTPVVSAQTAPEKDLGQPSRYIWYGVDQVNSGKFPVYANLVAQYRDAVSTTTPDMYWIAGMPLTGAAGRLTSVTFHDNMASVEKMMKNFEKVEKALVAKNANLTAMTTEAVSGSSWVLAEYDKEISYRPLLVPIADTTYWLTELVSLNPGCDYALNEVAKQVISVHQKAADNEHWIAYNIRGGYPQPAVLFVTPLRSLADRDQEPPAVVKESFENPMARQMFAKFDRECVKSVETNYLQVLPSLSRPSQALVAANPGFWTVKEEPLVAKKGKAKKAAAVTPAPAKEQMAKE